MWSKDIVVVAAGMGNCCFWAESFKLSRVCGSLEFCGPKFGAAVFRKMAFWCMSV